MILKLTIKILRKESYWRLSYFTLLQSKILISSCFEGTVLKYYNEGTYWRLDWDIWTWSDFDFAGIYVADMRRISVLINALPNLGLYFVACRTDAIFSRFSGQRRQALVGVQF